ncbi:MAG: chemotaxis protein CheW [Myxococcaceae bacterium]
MPPPADWDGLRRRLQQADRELASATGASKEKAQELLRERARALSLEAEVTQEGEARSLLAFRIGAGRFAVDLSAAAEVLRLETLTRIPGAPPHLAGVTSRRGELLLLVDLARCLSLPPSGIADLNQVVVIGQPGRQAGLLAAEILGIVEVPRKRCSPAPVEAPFVEGVAPGGLVVLDGQALIEGLFASVTPNPDGPRRIAP